MKQQYISILFTILTGMIGPSAFAYDAEIDGIYYNFSGETAIVTYGENRTGSYNGDVVIPDFVAYGGKTYSVTTIGSYAFKECSGLTSLTIGEGITTIGEDAFFGCSGLVSVAIGSGVTSIGKYAFAYCSGLTSVTIPNSVTSIGYFAFYGCSGLTTVTIPNSVTSIGKCTFANCSDLTSVTIPNSVTTIGENAFFGCYGLTSITFHCKEIGTWFEGKTSIKEVFLGDEVTNP